MHRRNRSHANKRRVYRLLERKQHEVPLEVPVQKRDGGSKKSRVVREETTKDSGE